MQQQQSSSNIEIVEKKVDVEQALSRMRRPLESTSINLEVYGIYSLPEAWKSKIEDPTEQLYQYELELCGINLRNAKVFPRELTEEEKAEMEAAKNVKAKQPPPKDPKKKEEEPSKEEIERQEKERRDKEEKERKLKEEWDALDEDTKFYRTNEDIYKEPCIKFHNVGAQKKIEQLQQQLQQVGEDEEQKQQLMEEISTLQRRLFIGNAITVKSSYELIEFEEFIVRDGGCWLKFNKLTPPEEEITDPKAAAAAKKAPAAKGGKGAAPEDMKPTFGCAWLSLEDLLVPGGLETKQRVYLQTCAPLIKKVGDDGVEKLVEADEFDPVFENARTYAYVKITLTEPVTPTIPEFPEPQPHEVVPVKQFIKWPFSKDPTEDFKKQLTLAIESLAKEYYNMFQNELEAELKGTGKSDSELSEAFEERKKEYLYEINTSGKYHILKEKLKKTIVRIVKEYFKMTGSFKGLSKDERDHFYSTLYAYLVDQMRQTVKALVQRKRNELHENITVTLDLFIKERDTVIESQTKEKLSERYLRLSYEYEHLYNNTQEAENYMLKYIGMFEGDPEKMLEVAKFYMRIGKSEKANDYLRDSYSFQIKNQNIALTYACYLLTQQRSKESIVILNKLSQDKFMEQTVNILLSVAYDMDQDFIISQKYKEQAALIRQREQGILKGSGCNFSYKPQSQPPIKYPQGSQPPTYPEPDANCQLQTKPAFENVRFTQNDFNQLYSEIGQYLLELGFSQLAEKMAQNIQVESNNKDEQVAINMLKGNIYYARKSYDIARQYFESVVETHPTDIQSIINIGHCQYFLKNYEQAEQSYLSAYRISSFTGQDIQDEYFYNRIGSTYSALGKYLTAVTFFEEGILHKKTSYGYYMQGYCSEKSNDRGYRDYALKSLYQANLMDPTNPDIWGAISLINVIYYNHNKLFQTLNEAFKLKISNIPLLKDMVQRQWDYGNYKNLRTCIEYAFRARASKDTMRHQKKCEEFLKSIKDIADIEQIKVKYRETLIKSNCIKEDEDFFYQSLIQEQERVNAEKKQLELQYQL